MKNRNAFLIVLATVIFSSCNQKKGDTENNVISGTDSSMMTKKDTTGSIADTSTAVRMIATKTDTTVVSGMAKPNPDKKGKKGKVTLAVAGAKSNEAMSVDKEGFYTNTEVLPAFPGGQKALENFFEKNINYPADAADNGVEGIVNLNFAVDENGKVYAPKITSDAIGYGVEKEALRVFAKMPTWTPGKIKGKNVKTKYTLPINFQLY